MSLACGDFQAGGLCTDISDAFEKGYNAVVGELVLPILSQRVGILRTARNGIDEVVRPRVGDKVDNGSVFAPKRDQRLVPPCVRRPEESKAAASLM